MSVAATILSDKLSFTKERATAVREMLIPWADIETYITEHFTTVFIPGQGFTYAAVARHPIWTWCKVEGIEFDPFFDNPPADAGVYDYPDGAKATVTYVGEALNADDGGGEEKPDVPSGTYLSISAEYGVDMMTLPGHALEWEDGTDIDEVDAGKLIHTTVYRMAWSNVTHPPWDDIDECQGKVNAAGWVGKPKETMLFAGAGVSRDFDYEGSEVYKLDYIFTKKHIREGGVDYGWNHFYRQGKDPEWQKIRNATTKKFVYSTTDFDKLFRVN